MAEPGTEPLFNGDDDLVVLGNLLWRWIEGGAEQDTYIDITDRHLTIDGHITIDPAEHAVLTKIKAWKAAHPDAE